jgi:hypothetical protein
MRPSSRTVDPTGRGLSLPVNRSRWIASTVDHLSAVGGDPMHCAAAYCAKYQVCWQEIMAVKSRRNSRRKRHRTLALIAAATTALVVGLVIYAVVAILRQPKSPHSAVPPSIVPPTTSSAAHPKKPRPASQDASCPDVQLISIPGTWESSPQDNPLNPVEFPKALLLNVTRPITEQFNSSRVETYTVPYTAQFHNPFSGDK